MSFIKIISNNIGKFIPWTIVRLLYVLDKITDPHNVGAIIRSCDQFGVSLVLIPEHKSSNNIEDNDVIARSSAGASAWVPVSIVNNLVRAVEKLKEAGFWVYGADAGGQTCGKIDSLNVSVATGVLLYEIFRRKNI